MKNSSEAQKSRETINKHLAFVKALIALHEQQFPDDRFLGVDLDPDSVPVEPIVVVDTKQHYHSIQPNGSAVCVGIQQFNEECIGGKWGETGRKFNELNAIDFVFMPEVASDPSLNDHQRAQISQNVAFAQMRNGFMQYESTFGDFERRATMFKAHVFDDNKFLAFLNNDPTPVPRTASFGQGMEGLPPPKAAEGYAYRKHQLKTWYLSQRLSLSLEDPFK